MNRTLVATALLVTAGLLACAGCSPFKAKYPKVAKALDVRRAMWWKEQKPDPQIPVRLVTSWTDTVLHRPGQKSQRGFGGRLSFFGRESQDPVRVEGQLVVYAYDESKGDPENVHPTRRYIFPKDQVERMESKSSLGPSYSVWLPWDEEVSGERKNISLIARFEPEGGSLLVGEQTRHLLPGTALENEVPSITPDTNNIQLTQHTMPAVAQPGADCVAAKPELTTKSIRLADHWRDRLATPTTVDSFRAKYEAPMPQPAESSMQSTEPAVPRELLLSRGSTAPSQRSARPLTGSLPVTRPAVATPSSR